MGVDTILDIHLVRTAYTTYPRAEKIEAAPRHKRSLTNLIPFKPH